ncbi:hypothetical protein, partial [Rouxiella badensis]|uniref:hypothetical protein n=1 Tax=Rouxiella badensis TaxID=1646377 RepID=UPI0019D36666
LAWEGPLAGLGQRPACKARAFDLKDFNRKSGSGPLPHKPQKQPQCSIQPPWHVPLTKKIAI